MKCSVAERAQVVIVNKSGRIADVFEYVNPIMVSQTTRGCS
jgi:hypothetical protein